MLDPQVLKIVSDASGDLLTVARTVEIELYCKVALASLLLYHALVTLDKEVKYFWHCRSSVVRLVYFLVFTCFLVILEERSNIDENRTNTSGSSQFISAFDFILGTYLRLCTSVTWIHNIADWATVLLIDYILLIRVLALYSQDRGLSISLSTLLVLEASLRLAFMIVAVSAEVAQQKHLIPEFTPCVEQSKCSLRIWETLYSGVIPMIYQVILALLACYKAAEYWRVSADFRGFVLIRVLVTDQIVYFGMVLLCSAVNIVKCWVRSDPLLAALSTVLGSTVLLCLLGSTLLFNLKEAGELGLNGGTSYRISSKSASDIQFREPTTV